MTFTSFQLAETSLSLTRFQIFSGSPCEPAIGLTTNTFPTTMAILDELLGLEVEVVVNGQPLKEYTDTFVDEDQPKTVVKYIEAVSGANFEIRCRFTSPYPHQEVVNGVEVRLDGERAGFILIRKSCLMPLLSEFTSSIQGRRTGQGQTWSQEKFRFAELSIGTFSVFLIYFAK